MTAIVISWVIISVIVAALAEDREIGFGQALLICLFLSPLIGAIFVATSPKASATPPLPREVGKLVRSGDAKFSSGNLDAALADYEKILTLSTKNPNTHFKVACIYSNKKNSTQAYSHLSKAVQDGFNNFQRIMSAKELAFLRGQVGFQKFAQERYKLPERLKSDDTISKLERLAQLKEKGVLTANEFEEQKRKILASQSKLLLARLPNRRFEFEKRGQLFIRVHNETLSAVTMCISNEDRSPVGINRCDAAPTPTGFAEIVSDDSTMSVSKESTVERSPWFKRVLGSVSWCQGGLSLEAARDYLEGHPGIAIAGGIVVILSTMNLAVMVGRARRRSMEIAEALKNLGIDSVLYRHRILDQRQAVSLTTFNVMVGVIILYMLLNILLGA